MADQSQRTRNFATVVYMDSAPENWLDILSDSRVPAFVSPFHDRDTNPDGTSKKPHYHVMVMFDSVKTDRQARDLFETFSGVGCEIVKSTRGYARYLCHLDNPDKAQYSVEDVKQFSGADYIEVISLASDRYHAIREMIDYCNDYSITDYCDLLVYASQFRDDWFRILCDNGTVVMREYLKSKTFKAHMS